MVIEAYAPEHLDAVVALSLRAWSPVFASMEQAMDPAVFQAFFPDWREVQAESVRSVCQSDDMSVWVAMISDAVAGFVALKLDHTEGVGEIHMIAVDPAHQRSGVGAALTAFALEVFQKKGMRLAMVETGGDPGHGPARALYERAGFGLFPVARYFKKL